MRQVRAVLVVGSADSPSRSGFVVLATIRIQIAIELTGSLKIVVGSEVTQFSHPCAKRVMPKTVALLRAEASHCFKRRHQRCARHFSGLGVNDVEHRVPSGLLEEGQARYCSDVSRKR